MPAIKENFANRLEHEMKVRGWNQSELARRASLHLPNGEISRDNISNYCRARALPSPAFLRAISLALGVAEHDLLPERSIKSAENTGNLPATDVRDAGEGKAWVRVNKRVSWAAAMKILQAINEDTNGNAAPADNK